MTDLAINDLKSRMDKIEGKVDDWFSKLMQKFEDLENKYVTRLEFKAVASVFGIVVMAIGVIISILRYK